MPPDLARVFNERAGGRVFSMSMKTMMTATRTDNDDDGDDGNDNGISRPSWSYILRNI